MLARLVLRGRTVQVEKGNVHVVGRELFFHDLTNLFRKFMT